MVLLRYQKNGHGIKRVTEPLEGYPDLDLRPLLSARLTRVQLGSHASRLQIGLQTLDQCFSRNRSATGHRPASPVVPKPARSAVGSWEPCDLRTKAACVSAYTPALANCAFVYFGEIDRLIHSN